jgi:hypothetical protein
VFEQPTMGLREAFGGEVHWAVLMGVEGLLEVQRAVYNEQHWSKTEANDGAACPLSVSGSALHAQVMLHEWLGPVRSRGCSRGWGASWPWEWSSNREPLQCRVIDVTKRRSSYTSNLLPILRGSF